MRYTREDGCRAWLTYALAHADIIANILEEFGSAEAVYDRFIQKGPAFLKEKLSDFSLEQLTEHSSKEMMHDMLVCMRKLNMGIMSIQDPLYPDSLRNLSSPPALLFYRGNPKCLMGKCITVVGSRTSSQQGAEATRKICRDFSKAGVCIVSGLAMGIDTAAHEGCLEGGSPTAAVLACGIDVDYPIENVELKERIVQTGGVLLSEYPPGTRASRFVFQVRNRILSGLSRAVVMMEGQIQSGSMLTVQHALDQGMDVYAYPGNPDTESAEGAHQLLREGAIFFTRAQDILEDFGWDDAISNHRPESNGVLPDLNDDQRSVFSLLCKGELSYDQLAEMSGLQPAALSVALTMLQMQGLIKAMPGKIYCRV